MTPGAFPSWTAGHSAAPWKELPGSTRPHSPLPCPHRRSNSHHTAGFPSTRTQHAPLSQLPLCGQRTVPPSTVFAPRARA